jgi:hypothetical protein
VVAGADDGVVALDWTKAGDGTLYPRDPGGEPDEAPTGKEAGKIETTSFKHGRKARMRNQKCHFSRTDPFKIVFAPQYNPDDHEQTI